MRRSSSKKADRSSPRNSSRQATWATAKTSTCTAASWVPVTCPKTAKASPCLKNFERIDRATQELARRYDTVLVEGAGGLMVPLKDEYLTIDYIAEKGYPLIFVTSGKLGSVNHTLLSLEAVARRDIRLDTVLYNLYPTLDDTTIQQDTQQYLRRYLERHFPQCRFLTVPVLEE